MVTKTYTDSKELTRDLWSHGTRDEKEKLLKSIGANLSWAKTNSATEMATRGGGLVLSELKNLNEEFIKRKGGKVTITWNN